MELLSPCGNFESLIGVINAGADAVYLAGNKYGARAYADNFTDEEIIKAIKYSHLMNVKVYLTVNTLIKEKEYSDVISYITNFYNVGLDACIIQDIGLISVFNSIFPQMECHISTQAFSTGVDSVNLYKQLGATRVVLARELSLNEIKEIKSNCDIEIETFIHGAMCYSYSGQCLFSSCLGGRSGNRGRCAGPCRLNYERNNKAGYLLSMKDQCTLEILPSLIEAGIDSFKIEGRMKKPEYAAFVTSMYRKYIDLYNTNPGSYKVSSDDLRMLNSFYMRSEIGTGYYNQRNGKTMLCIDNPAYAGTDESLLINTQKRFLSNSRKLPIDIYVECYPESPLSVTFINSDICVSKTGSIVQSSQNRPVTEADIIKQISKLGDTFFYAENVYVTLAEKSFLPLKELNEIRRQLTSELEDLLLKNYPLPRKTITSFSSLRPQKDINKPLIAVTSLEQLKALVACNTTEIILIVDDELFSNEKEYIFTLDKTIYTIIINLPHIIRNDNACLINNYLKEDKISGYLCNNIEEVFRLYNTGKIIIAGPGLYTWNKKALEFIKSVSDLFIYSFELSQYEIKDLNDNTGYTMVYGRVPLMQSANCIEKTTNGCLRGKGNIFSYISDRKNMTFPVRRNCKSCYNTIYNSVPTSLHDEGILCKINSRIFISLTDEDYNETRDIINAFLLRKTEFNPKEFTRGYYKRGVE